MLFFHCGGDGAVEHLLPSRGFFVHERKRGLYKPARKAFEESAVRDIVEQFIIRDDYNDIGTALEFRIFGTFEALLRGIHAAASFFKFSALLLKSQANYRKKSEIVAQKHSRYRGIESAEHSALGAIYASVKLIILDFELGLESFDIACHLFPQKVFCVSLAYFISKNHKIG